MATGIQLPPAPQPIGVFEPFVAKSTESLILKQKILSASGDSFDICLPSGQPLIRVEGQFRTLSARKKVYDASGGKYLFDVYKEHFRLHSTYVVADEQENKVMEVKSSFKMIGSKATATFTSFGGQPVSLVMSGNWLSISADIVDEATGAVVARIDRKLFNSHAALIVAPGVDMALMAALCVCLDENQNQKKGMSSPAPPA